MKVKVKLDCPMYIKQAILKGEFSWNKMWSLKSLASLHAVQYK